MAPSPTLAAVAVALCLLAAASAFPGTVSSPASLEEACVSAGAQRDLCVQALSPDPASRRTPLDTVALARAAVVLARENATATAENLSSIYDFTELENKTVELQQCLEDCEERYEAAVDSLGEAAVALDSGAFAEAGALIAAGQAEVKLCQRECQAVREKKHRDVLTDRNGSVDRLCSVAISITRLLEAQPIPN